MCRCFDLKLDLEILESAKDVIYHRCDIFHIMYIKLSSMMMCHSLFKELELSSKVLMSIILRDKTCVW